MAEPTEAVSPPRRVAGAHVKVVLSETRGDGSLAVRSTSDACSAAPSSRPPASRSRCACWRARRSAPPARPGCSMQISDEVTRWHRGSLVPVTGLPRLGGRPTPAPPGVDRRPPAHLLTLSPGDICAGSVEGRDPPARSARRRRSRWRRRNRNSQGQGAPPRGDRGPAPREPAAPKRGFPGPIGQFLVEGAGRLVGERPPLRA